MRTLLLKTHFFLMSVLSMYVINRIRRVQIDSLGHNMPYATFITAVVNKFNHIQSSV